MRTAFLFIMLLWLSACGGFEPLYAKRQNSLDDILNRVKFESTSGRDGQVLYTALYERLKTKSGDANDNGGADYVLKVTNLDIRRSGIGTAADGSFQLDQIIVTADFSLLDGQQYEILESFRLRAVSTYNVTGGDAYSTEVTFQNSRDHILYNIAEQARVRLLSILRGQGIS